MKLSDNKKLAAIKAAMNMNLILAYIFEVFCVAGLVVSVIQLFVLDDLLDSLQVAARMFMLLAFVIMSSYYTSHNSGGKVSTGKENKRGGGV